MAFSTESVISSFQIIDLRFNFEFELKDNQTQIITHVLNKHDVIGILSTGQIYIFLFVLIILNI